MHPGDYLQSELLARAGFVHGFFTRRGGVSTGPFASLNLSAEVGDEAEHVRENLKRVVAVLGLGADRLYVPRQVHGREVLVLESQTPAVNTLLSTPADALVSSQPDLACAVRTADCVPILIGDRTSRRVAAIHAGWRGVTLNIVGASVARMLQLGSRPEALIGAIGPHISVRAFEVGEDVAAQLSGASAAADVVVRSPGQAPRVDLHAIVRAQLLAAGLGAAAVERVVGCTFSEPDAFFSYRRDGQQSGRMLSAIVAGEHTPGSRRTEPNCRTAQQVAAGEVT
jgi:purine-nucleoside/S-methyl-5'-thioadenosine phosphorylase / adenosine deaminase